MPDMLDVTKLAPLAEDAAAAIKAAAMGAGAVPGVAPAPKLATKPGKERWPVKTGTDGDAGEVGTGYVETTVEEMIAFARPSDMLPPTGEFSQYQSARAEPVETTIWRITADIIALKQETDGDYHLELQGDSGQTMIAEVPTPGPPFVADTSPFLAGITASRKAVDDKLVKPLKPADFTLMGNTLVPRTALPDAPPPPAAPAGPAGPAGAAPRTFLPPGEGPAAMPTFKTKVRARATITGVGFFDRLHDQLGVAANGIEIHPVLDIRFE
jgi:hypothetical protein